MGIKRININELTYEDFKENFVDKQALIIQGIMEEWPISGTNLNSFKLKYGDKKVPIRGSNVDDFNKYNQVKLSDYIDHMDDNEKRYYCDFNPQLKGYSDLYDEFTIPEYFTIDTTSTNNNDELLQWFYLGSTNTGTPLHTDVDGSNAWNALVFGEKEWIIFPLDSSIEQYEGSIDLLNKSEESEKILRDEPHIHFYQQPNEIVYIPSHFPHQVRNTTPSLCITGNFWFK